MERILSSCSLLCLVFLLTICHDVYSVKEGDIPHVVMDSGQHSIQQKQSQKIEKRALPYTADAWKGKRLNPYAFYGNRGKRRSLDIVDRLRRGAPGSDGGTSDYDIVNFVNDYNPNAQHKIRATELKRVPELANSLSRYGGDRDSLYSSLYPFIRNLGNGANKRIPDDLKRMRDALKRDVHVPDMNAFFGSRGKRVSFGSTLDELEMPDIWRAGQSRVVEKRQGEQYATLVELAKFLEHEKAMRKKIVPMGFYGVRGKRGSSNISNSYRLFLIRSIQNMIREHGGLPENMPDFNAAYFKRQPPPLQYYANRG